MNDFAIRKSKFEADISNKDVVSLWRSYIRLVTNMKKATFEGMRQKLSVMNCVTELFGDTDRMWIILKDQF